VYKIKIAYNPIKDRVLVCKGQFHADEMPVKSFDKWVRAIYFPECKTIYFRFYSPSGEYHFLTQDDESLSFEMCKKALQSFIQNQVVPKRVKALFWETNSNVKNIDISY
jgi:hypothetical protein